MKFYFTAKDLAFHFQMNEKTAQRWAKAKDWRFNAYKSLQNQMLQDLANKAKEMK